VSLQRWEIDDTLILIDWAANESAAAIKAGKNLDAAKLLRGAAAVIGLGENAMTTDSRLRKWLDFRMSEVSYPLRDYKRNGSGMDSIQRQRILTSLDMLAKYYKNNDESSVHTLGEEIVLPEPFDENSVFW
jgi:hypothetical protein